MKGVGRTIGDEHPQNENDFLLYYAAEKGKRKAKVWRKLSSCWDTCVMRDGFVYWKAVFELVISIKSDKELHSSMKEYARIRAQCFLKAEEDELKKAKKKKREKDDNMDEEEGDNLDTDTHQESANDGPCGGDGDEQEHYRHDLLQVMSLFVISNNRCETLYDDVDHLASKLLEKLDEYGNFRAPRYKKRKISSDND